MNSFGKFIGFLFVLSFLAALWIDVVAPMNRHMQTARQGVLDLTGSGFPGQDPINLDGEWEFYEGELLKPADFQSPVPRKASYLTVPGTWKGKSEDKGVSRRGFGTYRLQVLTDPVDEIYGIKVSSIRMSHELYINGKRMGGSGAPAAVKELHSPGNTPYTTFFHAGSGQIDIVIQVSNFMYFTGGVVNSIQFGLQGDMAKMDAFKLGIDMACILIFIMFGVHHLHLYVIHKRDKSYLYCGLYLLFLSSIQLLLGEKVFQRLLPEIPFEIVYKALDLSEFLSAVLGILFICSINTRLLSPKAQMLLIAPIVLYMTAIVVLPYSVYNEVRFGFFLYLGLVGLYTIVRMVALYWTSDKGTYQRKEQLLFIAVNIALMVYLAGDSLYSENVVSSNLSSKLALIGFVMLMNILLAIRFTRAFEQAQMLTRQLTLSNQVKDEFLMHTSHEIRTPLHGILNITSYLLDDDERNLTAKQLQSLSLVKDTAIKLSMLMQDLIDVTRLKHGELQMQISAVGVKAVAQIVLDVLQFELAGKAVKLENEIAASVWVQADENRLRQVLYNLVHNAIKHTEKGIVAVRATVADGMVHIFVEDTGTGISAEKRVNIFEYGERSEQPWPADRYTGMGVGLYICSQLASRMGGDIRIDWSEVGKGTRMAFALPAAAALHAPAAYDGSLEERLGGGDVRMPDSLDIVERHEHTILIVDDEASNIHTLLNILRRQRCNVVVALSAKEALAKINGELRVDLVILDVMMPDISGIELCRMLRLQYSILDLPILFATAKDHPQDIAVGFAAGANDYLIKPFEAETLIARIQTLLAMKTSIGEAIRNELAFHQAQIKPHFLYNALSSVISFCYSDGEKAAYLLSRLSEYLRFILDMDRHELFVPLHRELELIEAYVDIEKARFGERFDFVCEVDDHLRHLMIPSLCIQPFVENAIRHGMFDKEEQGTVALTIREGERYVQVTVQDDGVGIPDDLLYLLLSGGDKSVGGIGIYNIRRRLGSIPGAALNMDSEIGRGTKVTLYLPLHENSPESGDGEGKQVD